jgi:negative regulator of sigma E activity
MSRLSQSVPHFVAAAPAESDAANATREAIVPAAPWIERLARVGYAAKAVLYTVVGVLALRAALGDGGKTIG